MKPKKVPIFEQLNRNVNLYLKNEINFENLITSIKSKRMRELFLDCFNDKKSNQFHKYRADKKGWGKIYYIYCEQAIRCREKNQYKLIF